MGNTHAPIIHDADKTNGSLKLLMNERKLRKENKKYQEFFMSYNRMYNISHKMDISSLCPKRIVFISINGLYNTWRNIPPMSLYNAIFILPLKQEWIQSPDKYKHEYSHLLEDKDFLTILRWKHHQRLTVFLLDNDDDDNDRDSLIAPVWEKLSVRLQELHDPTGINNGKYKPLIFDETYWKLSSTISCEQITTGLTIDSKPVVQDIFLELCTVTMKFKTIKQILIESNPSLNVITHYYNPNITQIRFKINLSQQIENRVSPQIYPAPTPSSIPTEFPITTTLILSPTTSSTAMDDTISSIPYSPCPPPQSNQIQSNLPLPRIINDGNNETLLNINDERDVSHETEKHQYGIFEKHEDKDEDDMKYSCANDNNNNDVILGKDWWISSDYFDDFEQDNKVLQEFDAIYNDNNNCDSDNDSYSQTRCDVHNQSQLNA